MLASILSKCTFKLNILCMYWHCELYVSIQSNLDQQLEGAIALEDKSDPFLDAGDAKDEYCGPAVSLFSGRMSLTLMQSLRCSILSEEWESVGNQEAAELI